MIFILLVVITLAGAQDDCDPENVLFELRTGYVLSAPGAVLDTKADTLILSHCIEACRNDPSCKALNFETGLCVLFANASQDLPGKLRSSEFPVYTVYLEKVCVKNAATLCGDRAWGFELVTDHKLHDTFVSTRRKTATKELCFESCLNEVQFTCRSATWEASTESCLLSDNDRHSVTFRGGFSTSNGSFYMESNCVDDNVKLCDFVKKEGRILKTVDAVFEDIESFEDCKKLCLDGNFRCHSFDYGDIAEKVCRISHHSMNTLSHIKEPYLDVPSSSTYEITSCFNVTIDCRASEMIVKVKASRNFNGKIYARLNPNSCVNDVTRSLEFELQLGYQDSSCSVSQEEPGKFVSEVVIQNHDQIVTTQDVGLSLRCSYTLKNYTVSSNLELAISGRIPALKEETAVVPAPTVRLRITGRNGEQVASAQVGDPLALRFEIFEKNSPYELFIRELVALDGTDSSEITLIDEHGCPTDQEIMGPALKVNGSGQVLTVPFDAFKFPTSDIVQFKALVTPCLPSCQPAECDMNDNFGLERSFTSFGRRRREADIDQDEMLLIQTIRISDKFETESKTDAFKASEGGGTSIAKSLDNETCSNIVSLFIACGLFLVAQIVLIGAFVYIWGRQKQNKSDNVPSFNPYVNSAFQR
ncbi:uncharacterized protein LOC136032661 [Artemia franciscana]|uniref:uncharacterized protein LOC136032661 n=1 Tax=Artemia franciscana TaxID=6661 RepID=UPI0032DB6468